MSDSTLPPPLPANPVTIVDAFTAPPAGATPLGSVILAFLSLELNSWKRPRFWLKLVLVGIGLVVLTKLSVARANSAQFERWMIDVVALKLVPLLCLVVGGGMLRNPIRSFTIEYLWTRPAKKHHLVVAAWLTTVVIVTAQAILATVVVHATCGFFGLRGVWDHLAMTCAVEFAMILPFSAIAVALGVTTGKYMVMGLFYAFVVENGIGRLPTNLNQLAVTRHAKFLLKEARQATDGLASWPLFQSTGVLLILAVLAVVVACIVFSNKQYSIGSEKES
ncbi:MAG: hypothetical protein HS122_18980 [Opitutaceae bacterium]|nr:hypothetical protein [Opitutaceae bacterium]